MIERRIDIRRLTHFRLGAWLGAAKIDLERIGFFGFSRGGHTELVIVNGNADFAGRPR